MVRFRRGLLVDAVATMRTVNIVDEDDVNEEDPLPYAVLSYTWSEDAGIEQAGFYVIIFYKK